MGTGGDLEELLERVKDLEAEGRAAEALELLDARIAAGPAEAVVYAYRGHSLFEAKRYAKALVDLDRAIGMHPGAMNTLYIRARCKEELNDPRGALADYRASERLGLREVWLHINMGLILGYLGDPAGAASEYLKALDLEPASGTAQRLLERARLRISGREPD